MVVALPHDVKVHALVPGLALLAAACFHESDLEAATVTLPVVDVHARGQVELASEREPAADGRHVVSLADSGAPLDEDGPRGTVVVHIDAPAGVPAMVDVTFVDESPPGGFLRTGDARVLRDWLDCACWLWDPLESLEGIDPENPRPRIVGDRVQVELVASDLPLERRLWACLSTVHWDRCELQVGYSPGVVEIPPIESVDEPARIAFRLHPFGGISGRVVGFEPRIDEDTDVDDEEAEPTWEELALQVCEVDARILGTESTARTSKDGRFQIWPIASGHYDFDVLVTTYESLHRRVDSAVVRNGESTEIGTWTLAETTPVTVLQSSDEDGSPLHGRFVLELAGYPTVSIQADWLGQASLCGDWSDCLRIHFEPRDDHLFDRTTIEMSPTPRLLVTFVCRRRSTVLSRFVLKPMWRNTPMWGQHAWAYVRRGTAQRWWAVDLGYFSGGCVVRESELLEPGRHDVIAWLPKRGLAFRGPLYVPPWTGDSPFLELGFEDPGTRVRGTLHMTCAGVEAWDQLETSVRPEGTDVVVPYHAGNVFDHATIGTPGPFEFRGVPPDVDLVLMFRDDAGRIVGRRQLRVSPDETLDLGVVEAVLK